MLKPLLLLPLLLLLQVTLRLRRPMAGEEVVVLEEKELAVGDWPALAQQFDSSGGSTSILPATPTGTTLQPATMPQLNSGRSSYTPPALSSSNSGNSGSRSRQQQQQQGRGRGRGTATVTPTKPTAAAGSSGSASASGNKANGSILTESEKSDPLAPEHIDSNNVLESELALYDAAGPSAALEPTEAARRSMLELKLRCLEGAVSGGELELPEYCQILSDRLQRDRVLAVWLKGEGRVKEAVRVLKRVKLMEEELAGAPDEAKAGLKM
jgi:hypothetical protein